LTPEQQAEAVADCERESQLRSATKERQRLGRKRDGWLARHPLDGRFLHKALTEEAEDVIRQMDREDIAIRARKQKARKYRVRPKRQKGHREEIIRKVAKSWGITPRTMTRYWTNARSGQT
jgi:hypothetical protein